MIVSMVVAMGPKGEIGRDNKLLWHIPSDLKNFKKITSGKMVVMGRKTFESIGRPLPNRTNIVITRDPTFSHPGVKVINDPLMALDLALEMEEDSGVEDFELMVIGGEEIFNIFLPYTQKIYLSEVPYGGEADAFFPLTDFSGWGEESSEVFAEFSFRVLVKL